MRLNLRDNMSCDLEKLMSLPKCHFYKSEFNVNSTAEITCF
jgi:hypothetical protein